MAAGGVAPVAVSAKEGPKTRPDIFSDVEESMTWTMEFAGGAVCEAATSYRANGNEFRAEAERGWIELHNAFSYNGLSGATSRAKLDFNPPVNQQARQMDDFAQCVIENRPTRVPGDMGVRDMKIIAAIYESAANGGKRVEVKA
jgi:glucose-fructose oxidoreductase